MIQRTDVDQDGQIIDHDTQQLVEREQHGSLSYNIPREFRILDPTAPGGIVTIEPRPEWLATISAGFKKKNDRGIEYPAVSRDGKIYIPDDKDRERAPELVKALEANGNKSLTIAFCSDDLNDNIVQRYVHYSASSLDIFGDETALTHVTATAKSEGKPASLKFEKHYAGTAEYAKLAAKCKAETSVLFALAEWTPEGEPRIVWSGAFGRYRIRFTSRNSIRNILSYLTNTLMPLTRGRLAGIPLELTIGYRDVAGPDPLKGWARHNIPVWELRLVYPGGIKVDPMKLDRVVERAAINAGPLRALPSPQYTVEHALLMAPDEIEDLDALDLSEVLTSNDPPCDPKYYRDHFHAMVANDALLKTDTGRHKFVRKFTEERWPDNARRHTGSLEVFLGGDKEAGIPPASESEASALIAKVGEVMTELQRQRMAKRAQNGGASTTMTVEPEPDKEPPPTEPASAPAPEEKPAPEEEAPPIAAEAEEEPDIGQHDEQPVEGEFREALAEDPPTTEPATGTDAESEPPQRPATDKQKQEIRDYAPPSVRSAIDFDTLTFDDAALTLESIGRGGR